MSLGDELFGVRGGAAIYLASAASREGAPMSEVAWSERAPGVSMDLDGPVAILTLDRPEVRNAIDFPTAREFDRLLSVVEADETIEAAVLTAVGESVFCAGSDLKAKARKEPRPVTERGGFAGVVRWPRSKPLVAAVDGRALGGGFELALACDFVIASERASFGLPEVRHGIVAGGGGLLRLPRRLPFPIACEVVLAGRRLTAEDALRWGLVNAVVPAGAAHRAAVELAHTLCGDSALAVRHSLRVMRAAIATDEERLWDFSEQASRLTQASEQGQRGVQAFAAGSGRHLS
jgi:enoyl-CoA hydratase/carnithine racemase